jgi:hypothetical protein
LIRLLTPNVNVRSVGACERRVCWGTPAEIKKLVELGYAERLMMDYWVGNFNGGDDDIHVVAPAIVDYGGRGAPFHPLGRCNFLENNLCVIHAYKPAEGRKGGSCQDAKDPFNLHEHIARMWDTEEGMEVVNLWRSQLKR